MTGEGRVAADEQVTRGRQRRSTYVVAAVVVVGAAVMGTAAMTDGDSGRSDLLVSFGLMLIPPLVGAVVALAFGRRLIRRTPRRAAEPALIDARTVQTRDRRRGTCPSAPMR
ncbi:hypothetical protein GAR06_00128 [Micromonospora saelicesensis]|uniref:hypothetical protein n=1 Tax=Micromonospora saelicesensis TaxID=285676 RepID=UPI000DC29A96|nr:hypothetical protein [Micromonospora saelicesensis]RAO50572.1 hypothetical protein GAR06_00128 [Micromonospora saelicesensis]